MEKFNKPIRVWVCMSALLMLYSYTNSIVAQCTSVAGTVSGVVYLDQDQDGIRDAEEQLVSGVAVQVTDAEGTTLADVMTDNNGAYTVPDLPDGDQVRVTYDFDQAIYTVGTLSASNASAVRFSSVPECDASLGLSVIDAGCADNPDIMLTCFVRGETTERPTGTAIIGIPALYTDKADAFPVATHGEVGSVWGVAYKKKTQELFSAAFVKQYCGLKENHSTIFRTVPTSTGYTTSPYVDISNLGITVAPLTNTDVGDCAYSQQVGRYGLGAMVLDEAEENLYVVNISENEIVKLPTSGAVAANTTSYDVPAPGCGSYRVFALEWYNGKLYVGATCTQESSSASVTAKDEASSATVYTFDPKTELFEQVFSTNYIKGHWGDFPASSSRQTQWLTDIAITAQGQMILGIGDRVGHSYCNEQEGIVHGHKPDILIAHRENGEWVLESNGRAGAYTGTGVSNGEGPGGGEFFGNDHWTTNPIAHPDVTLGSVLAVPGTDLVIATVFDPEIDPYSGGLHTYSSKTGERLNSVELYSNSVIVEFGKATGFGGITSTCESQPIQIGNYAWNDTNSNGLQDAGEAAIDGLALNLYDSTCQLVGSTTTDTDGYYTFDLNNVSGGVLPSTQYYIALDESQHDPTSQFIIINGKDHILTQTGVNPILGSDAEAGLTDCAAQVLIPVRTPAAGNNDYSFDIGLNGNLLFDLALRKEVVSNPFVRFGDLVDFEIEVFNQGNYVADSIVVIDYVPSGLTFNEADNLRWAEVDGDIRYIIESPLPAGESVKIPLTLRADGVGTDYINFAEIFDAQDLEGGHPADTDSSFDAIKNNDSGGAWNGATDNEVLDDGTIDEDDHDPAAVQVFDLALKYELVGPIRRRVGESVEMLITVYNQGLVTADNYSIAVYQTQDLALSAVSGNSRWTMLNGAFRCMEPKDLEPGASRSYSIFFDISENTDLTEIVQWAEISMATALSPIPLQDFDSTPDLLPNNDNGGEVFTSTDNLVTDHGTIDEDDHDPVVIILETVDLALIKTSNSTIAEFGEEATFTITVTNQGTVPVYYIDLVDYLPEGLILSDTTWNEKGDNLATTTIEVADGLGYRQSVERTIVTRVALDAPSVMVNVAEISDYRDQNNGNLSAFDRDSTADEIKDNDLGGQVGSSFDNNITADPSDDEDDQDPARLIAAAIGQTIDSCLNNATGPLDGLYLAEFTMAGPSGVVWEVTSSSNMFRDGGTPDDLVALFDPNSPNVTMEETPDNMGTSTYTLTALYVEGNDFAFEVSDGGTPIGFMGTGGSYTDITINGERSLCGGSEATYTVSGPTGQYMWELTSGGTITSSPQGSSVSIQWDDVTGGPHELTVRSQDPNTCIAPSSIDVNLGEGGQTMSCYGSLNISLNQNCAIEVQPQTISSIPVNPNAGFSVMLLDGGEVIPGNTLTDLHIGKAISAKLIDGCGNNSCWTTIQVEDKIAPVVQVPDTVFVECTEMAVFMPQALDNCDNPVSDVRETFRTETVLHCNPDFVMRADVAYVATDAYGNVSAPASTIIMVRRPDLSQLVFPDNLMDTTSLICGTFDTMGMGLPALSATGLPRLGNIDLTPGIDLGICNIGVSTSIRRMGNIDCTTKYARTWTVYEAWCVNGVLEEHTQIIEVDDLEAPVFDNIPADFSALANSATCMASVALPTVTATDGCLGDAATVTVRANGAITSAPVVNLPVGTNLLTYFATDDCGRRDSINVMVEVEYIDGPTVVCDEETVVGINAQGVGYAYAATFDDGSSAGCGQIDSMKVRRVGAPDVCGLNTTAYQDIVEFCCQEVGDSVMVELAVWDDNGNSNSCMVRVFVQDNVAPNIVCPGDLTVACDALSSDLNDYGVAEATDQCTATVEELAPDMNLDDCGTGFIIRNFRAFDGTDTVTCSQRISVQYTNPYTFDPVRDSFPADLDTTLCAFDPLLPETLPPGFGFPIIRDQGTCSDLSVSYSDVIIDNFPADTTVLLKILRTWTIVDSCSNNPDFIVFTGQQTIKATNLNAVCPFMDIALIKQLNTVQTQLPVQINDLVTFDITVCNQGNTVVEEIEVVDYIPTGLTLSDGNWTPTGNMATRSLTPGAGLPAGGLLPDGDSCAVTTITLSLNANASPSTVLNYAEIKSSTDENGDTVDVDSTPDMIPDNDGDVFPGDPHDDSLEDGVDEDDYDVATIPIFDLALIKTTDATGPYSLGDVVEFDITITNQGSLDASEIVIVDYIPCGFTLAANANGWTVNAINEATFTVSQGLAVGAPPLVVTIPLEIVACIDADAYINVAEIASARDADGNITEDIDSNADTIENNDDGGVPNSGTDNTINNESGDEDDSDPALIELEYCDICPGLTLSGLMDIERGVIPGQCDTVVNIPVPSVSNSPCVESGMLSFTTQFENNTPSPGSGTDASGIYPVGTTTVTYRLESECDTVFESFTVTVMDDQGPVCSPDPIVHPPLTLTNNQLTVSIDEDFLRNQFNDVCGSVDPTFIIVSQSDFTCADAGAQTIQVTVRDNNGNETTCDAEVFIEEEVAPECNAQDITVYLDGNGEAVIVGADVVPFIDDQCGTDATVAVTPSTFDCSNIGDNTITVTITDDNGNTASNCTAMVTVEDTISPVCVLRDTFSVDLIGDTVTVDFGDVDLGTNDNCGDFTAVPSSVTFDCNTLGDSTVVYTIQDTSGNETVCSAVIRVVDNSMVQCVTVDTTVYLGSGGIVFIDPTFIDGGSTTGCGGTPMLSISNNTFGCSNLGDNTVTLTVSDGNSSLMCDAIVTVLDTTPPIIDAPTVLSIECEDYDISDLPSFTVEDNCESFLTTSIDEMVDDTGLNVCGIGTLTRTIIATDGSDNADTLVQMITVTNDNNQFTIDNISFPVADTTVTCDDAGAGITPIGMVTIDETGVDCSLVSISDTSFFSNPGECPDTLVTTWTVIDSCQFDGVLDGNGPGEFFFTQRIAIIDTVAPVIDFPLVAQGDTLFFYIDTPPCELFLSFPANVMDCSPLDTVFNDSDFADNPNSVSPDGTYPVGDYDITITARDECGNESTFDYVVSVQDTSAFDYFCSKLFPDITDSLMYTDRAIDYLIITDAGCKDTTLLDVSFTLDIADSLSFLDCNDLGDSSFFLYIFFDGVLIDSCKTLRSLEDPNGFCPSTLQSADIDGDIFTVRGEALPETYVELQGGNTDAMTDGSGHFTFGDMPTGGSYMVKPTNDTDHRRGVSTLDLILMQRHILGIQPFADAYSHLAADINASETITGADIVALRKLILGVTGDFSDNTSWRMVDAYQTFELPGDILYEVREEKLIGALNYDVIADFTAVKVGDVNGSVETGFDGGRSLDSRSALWFDTKMVDGEIQFIATEDINLRGLQFALQVDGLYSVESSNLKVASDQYHYANGQLSMSWYDVTGVDVEDGDVLFSIQQDVSAQKQYGLTDAVSAEAYIGQDLQTVPLQVRDAERVPTMSILQNTPNPWSSMTEIGVLVGETADVQIAILDVTGKVIRSFSEVCYPGLNKVTIQRDDLPVAGVYYYTVTDGKTTITEKMILLD